MLFENKLHTNRPNLFNLENEKVFEEPNLFEQTPQKKDEVEDELEEENISVKTPTIKILTPVRKKNPIDFKDIFEGTSFKKMFPLPHTKAPEIDYSDEDEVNERVRKLVSNSNNVDYSQEHEKVIEASKDAFEIKYKALHNNYPEHSIPFQREKNLNLIHKNYHSAIKTIYAHMNIGQTQLAYILILLVMEVVCIKVFNLPMAGFTKMEMKRMYKYNAMMIELGEAMYPSGGDGTPQPIEWRIATTFLWNIVIFLGIKLLSSYMGGDGMIDTVRTIVDKLFENNINADNIESGEAKKINAEENDLFSSLFDSGSDGASELAEFISSLGSSFTQNMENSRKGPKAKSKSRVIFDE